ncbi:unnamed protein product [Musa hybrid cultivar]
MFGEKLTGGADSSGGVEESDRRWGRAGQLWLKHSCPWFEDFIFYIKMQKQNMTRLGFIRLRKYIDIVVDESDPVLLFIRNRF